LAELIKPTRLSVRFFGAIMRQPGAKGKRFQLKKQAHG
jgi:hypothetical protein